MADWKPPKFGYPVWLSIPATDVERAYRFYSAVFAWPFKADQAEYPASEIRMFDFSPDVNLSGGIVKCPDHVGITKPGAGGISINWMVEDVDKTAAVIEQAGGEMLCAAEKEGKFGMYRYFKDTEGNVGAVYQMVSAAT